MNLSEVETLIKEVKIQNNLIVNVVQEDSIDHNLVYVLDSYIVRNYPILEKQDSFISFLLIEQEVV